MTSEKELIDTCLNAGQYDPKRVEACKKLTDKCYKLMHSKDKSAGDHERTRRQIEEKIIDDVKFVNEESIFDEKERIASGESFYRVVSQPNLFDGNFDENQYLDNKKGDRFEVCHIALYGLEKQFWQQVSEGLFQTEANSEALLEIESVIFDNNVGHQQYKRVNPKNLEDFLFTVIQGYKADEKFGYLDSDYEGELDVLYMIRTGNFKSLNDMPHNAEMSFEAYAISKGIPYKEYNEYFPTQLKKEQEICNDITNPKVKQGKYRICSQANLKGKQSFSIKIQRIIDHDKVKYASDAVISYKDRILQLLEEFERSVKAGGGSKDYLNHLESRIARLNELKEVEEIRLQELKRGYWYNVSELQCWHNFLGMVSYPEALKNRSLDVQLAYENGDISEKKATKLLKEIGQLEDAFKTKFEEGGASRGFTKPTMYQPTRARLYGSQFAVNDLLNKTLRFLPLNEDIVPNQYTRDTLLNAFAGIEYQQLTENVLLSEKIYKDKMQDYLDFTFDELYDKLTPIIREAALEWSFEDNWGTTLKSYIQRPFTSLNYYGEMKQISEYLWQDSNWRDVWRPYFKSFYLIEQDIVLVNSFDMDIDGIKFGRDILYWNETDLGIVGGLDIVIKEAYPTMPDYVAKELMRRFATTEWEFSGNENWILYIETSNFMGNIKEGVGKRLLLFGHWVKQKVPKLEFHIKKGLEEVIKAMNLTNRILISEGYGEFFKTEEELKKYGFKYSDYS